MKRARKTKNGAAKAVRSAIERAERLLPGVPAPDGREDPRWQAIIRLAKFIELHPEPLWEFCRRWGRHPQQDLRAAIACCLLEHLVDVHNEFQLRAEHESKISVRFAQTYTMCWTKRDKFRDRL